MGYQNLISLPNGEQVLNPTWNVEVNGTDNYSVNAIEGHNYPQNDNFVGETFAEFVDELRATEKDKLIYLQTEDEEEETALYQAIEQDLLKGVQDTTIGVGKE